MKRRALPLILAAALVAFAIAAAVPAQPSSSVLAADEREMTRLMDDFLALYDPGRSSVEHELEVSRRVFDTGPDFFMVVDAVPIPTWQRREERIRQRAAQSGAGADVEGIHETVEQHIVALGPDAAALTRMFRYRFTDRSGRKGHQDGAITSVFARRGGQWKIVQYHGSHRPRAFEAAEP